jgi:hypothetical protein
MEENKRHNVLRMTLTKDQIGSFVADLHRIQEDMINTVMANKEQQGFPEATAVIKHVMGLK